MTEEDEMAQGEFTKQEADATANAFEDIFEALPDTKQIDFMGLAKNIYAFLDAAKKAAPDKPE